MFATAVGGMIAPPVFLGSIQTGPTMVLVDHHDMMTIIKITTIMMATLKMMMAARWRRCRLSRRLGSGCSELL